ncbi:MAG TPA: 16S rRNA (cytidine(1402)-2'-O)-methyltransferase [Bacillales bacterium]|nr:16S rRNA (cytidine(1402)-2'-O)-methyltransferase [Bacillales bacterium]
MWIQQSVRREKSSGILYVVPTPIGNLEDMTFRAIRMLKEAHVIAAEDTRNTKKLCRHFEIDTPLVSYHEHNKNRSGEKLIADLEQGKDIALVSDAGMPAISDPGCELVKTCLSRRLPVVPLPGASAALPALVASGLATDRFFFYGFLPRGKKERKQQLAELKAITVPLIFYEAPHRLKDTVAAMAEIFGNRRVCVVREMTKAYEEWARGDLPAINEWLDGQAEPKGEFCVVVGGATGKNEEETPWWAELTAAEHVRHYVEIRGMAAKDAVKRTAVERGVPKREVYGTYHTGDEE